MPARLRGHDRLEDWFRHGYVHTAPSELWLHSDTGEVLYNHRCLITFAEMIYYVCLLRLVILHVYKLLFFADEFNDFVPIQRGPDPLDGAL